MQNLEPFRELAELNLKVYLSMESTAYGFPKQNAVSDVICVLPDLIWQLLKGKVSVLDERSEDFRKK